MFPEFLQEYLPIILFLIIALGLSCAFVVVNFILLFLDVFTVQIGHVFYALFIN